MNTQLVDSIVQIVASLLPAERELVKQKLFALDSNNRTEITGSLTKDFIVKTTTGVYNTSPKKPASVSQSLEIPEFSEIEGFKQAVELLLAGKHGTPLDFLYWLAGQKSHQFRLERSDLLDQLVNKDTYLNIKNQARNTA